MKQEAYEGELMELYRHAWEVKDLRLAFDLLDAGSKIDLVLSKKKEEQQMYKMLYMHWRYDYHRFWTWELN